MNIFLTSRCPTLWLAWLALLLLWLPAWAERRTPVVSSTKRQSQPVLTATPRPQTIELEAYLNLGNLVDDNRFDAPSQGLAFALRKHPKITRFRLQWSMKMAQTQINSTLFYNRRKQTLTFYSAGEIFGSRVRDHWHDSGVSDALLFRLADQTKGAQRGDNSAHFKQLARLGAQRQPVP